MVKDRSHLDGDIAAFIARAQLYDGVCPSYREIARQFGITTHDVLQALIRLQLRGHIRMLPHGLKRKARAIEVVSVPEPLVEKLLRVLEQIDAMRDGRKGDDEQ